MQSSEKISPMLPVYVDANLMRGRSIRYIHCGEDNGFTGDIPDGRVDLVYLCFPNNPTGAVITREKLSEWVQYALENEALILYDSAYEAFIREPGIPHSIYEIPHARECAIEFRSYSKTAGFTGIRCGYTVVPKNVFARVGKGKTVSLNELWERRQSCKFNGASYISQRGAEAIYTPEGRQQTKEMIDHYLETAALIRSSFKKSGLVTCGGDNAPYIWARIPGGIQSWDFFDLLLSRSGVIITPGVGFGPAGEGWFRASAFGDRDRTAVALERVSRVLNSI